MTDSEPLPELLDPDIARRMNISMLKLRIIEELACQGRPVEERWAKSVESIKWDLDRLTFHFFGKKE